jgi:multimeric flavodoxin WrbA
MKVLFLLGSGRQDGNTARAIEIFRESLERSSSEMGVVFEAETVFLGQENLLFCRGCRVCFDHGENFCPLKDGLLAVRDKVNAADALVIASPVYVEDVSGLIKNWIDRMAFHSHRPSLYGKCAWLITTSASRSTKHSLRTMSVALTTWGVKVLGGSMLFLGALSRKEEIGAKYGAALDKAARSLFKAVQSRSAEKPSLFSLIAFRVQQNMWRRKKNDSFDRRYWTNKGWLAPGCAYYVPNRAGVVKRLAAGLASWVVIALFK